ncbi:MAG: class I SAM-dependent methyltransferase [Chloroflexi bacterium]|nr:class I SAM-dependent methyltransferase [Chloroflexota bacterium]
MQPEKVTAQVVKTANREFYDAVADHYEELDGRRSPALETWLRGNLSELRGRAPGGSLLDIGAGSGLVTRCAEGLFAQRVGIDLSPRILAAHRACFDFGAAADVEHLPFRAASFDVVTCFAVLHHLYDFDGLIAEVKRVLKPAGIFYSDHDMDRGFSTRFQIPLSVYRKLRNARAKYQRASGAITPELYDLTEWQEQGVDAARLIGLLELAGFTVEARFHWFGLIPTLDRFVGTNLRGRGWSPLLSTVAMWTSS